MVRSTIFDVGVTSMVHPECWEPVGSIPSHGVEQEAGGKWMTDSGTDQKRQSRYLWITVQEAYHYTTEPVNYCESIPLSF